MSKRLVMTLVVEVPDDFTTWPDVRAIDTKQGWLDQIVEYGEPILLPNTERTSDGL